MKYLILKIEFDGTDFCGWQIQPKDRSVQEEIQNALYALFKREVKVIGAGRTDSGVHAREMTASARIDFEITIPSDKIDKAINSKLNKDVFVKSAVLSNDKFHARFDAKYRSYKYYINTIPTPINRRYSTLWQYPFDEELLFRTAEIFICETNFTTFSKINNDTKNHVCNVMESKWEKIGDGQYVFSIKANRFLYGMVRSLVGAMLEVARGYRDIEDVKEALFAIDRSRGSALAPAYGLFFEKAGY